ncbi:MAG: Tol-Pal system beta propeller repeat protein TolB [Thermodesulfobacteriota bacterium]|nr:Tol-Pal system beta propeller repeat protein TolB [Thermodesulfobacteriota bacterium]
MGLKNFKNATLYTLLMLVMGTFLSPHPSFSKTKVYLDIESPYFKRLPIAIPDFFEIGSSEGGSSIKKEISAVIRDDLTISGYFNVIKEEAYIDKPNSPLYYQHLNFSNWAIIGAEGLIIGNFTISGNFFVLEARLYDVIENKLVLGKRYIGEKSKLRITLHKFADDVIEEITGEKGIFSSKIAFVTTENENTELYVIDVDGYGLKRVTYHNSIILSPHWTPDGTVIGFISYKTGRPEAYVKNINSGNEAMLPPSGMKSSIVWSPQNDRLLLTISESGNSDIFLADTEGQIIRNLTNKWGIDVSPSFSPDGSEIVFVSDRSGNPNLYTMKIHGGSVRRLTYDGDYNASPAWSPKGDKIAYVSLKRGKFDIYTISPKGTEKKRLTYGTYSNEHPSWSPDGRYIVFTSKRDNAYKIYVMRANGENLRLLVSIDGNNAKTPSWSPYLQ